MMYVIYLFSIEDAVDIIVLIIVIVLIIAMYIASLPFRGDPLHENERYVDVGTFSWSYICL